MRMKPPTVPLDYVPPVYESELIQALELIQHATAPTPKDGGHHEAAHDIADEILKRVAKRRAFTGEPT